MIKLCILWKKSEPYLPQKRQTLNISNLSNLQENNNGSPYKIKIRQARYWFEGILKDPHSQMNNNKKI